MSSGATKTDAVNIIESWIYQHSLEDAVELYNAYVESLKHTTEAGIYKRHLTQHMNLCISRLTTPAEYELKCALDACEEVENAPKVYLLARDVAICRTRVMVLCNMMRVTGDSKVSLSQLRALSRWLEDIRVDPTGPFISYTSFKFDVAKYSHLPIFKRHSTLYVMLMNYEDVMATCLGNLDEILTNRTIIPLVELLNNT